MGAFSAFLDIAYGVAGPTAGLIAGSFGYASVYLLGFAAALIGVVLIVACRVSLPTNKIGNAHRGR